MQRIWRPVRGVYEDVCEHGVGHTIPTDCDDGIHGCDGCCGETK